MKFKELKMRSIQFCIKMKYIGGKDLDPFGCEQMIKIPNSSIKEPVNEKGRIISMEFLIVEEIGVRMRTILQGWQKIISKGCLVRHIHLIMKES